MIDFDRVHPAHAPPCAGSAAGGCARPDKAHDFLLTRFAPASDKLMISIVKLLFATRFPTVSQQHTVCSGADRVMLVRIGSKFKQRYFNNDDTDGRQAAWAAVRRCADAIAAADRGSMRATRNGDGGGTPGGESFPGRLVVLDRALCPCKLRALGQQSERLRHGWPGGANPRDTPVARRPRRVRE